MKLAALVVCVGSWVTLAVEGKKTKYRYKENSHHVHIWNYWSTEECKYFNEFRIQTNDGVYREPGAQEISPGPGSVLAFGMYYYDCVGLNAMRKYFSYNVEFAEFEGVHEVNGVENTTVSIESQIVSRHTQECSFNDQDFRYVCYTIDSEELPLSFAQRAVTSGRSYTFRDKSVDRGPGFVIKTNALSYCNDVSSATFDLVLGDEVWNSEKAMGEGHLCKYESGYSEKYTVS